MTFYKFVNIVNEKDLKDASKQMREYLDPQHNDPMENKILLKKMKLSIVLPMNYL